MSNVGSGIAAGAASGAATGAGVGTAASPGIGTAIGAAIGAIGGAIAGGVTAKQNEKNREKEVKRIEEREDNAIRRATADSLLSGIDPRSSGQAPTAASAGSVAPQELPEALSDFVQAGGQLAGSFQRRIDLDVEAQQIVGSNYQKFLTNADNQYQNTFAERNKLMIDMATRVGTTTEELNKVSNSAMTLVKQSKESYSGFTKTKQYHDFVDKIDTNQSNAFANITKQDWEQFLDSSGFNIGFDGSGSSGSNQGAGSDQNTYKKQYNSKTGVFETVLDKGSKLASKANLISAIIDKFNAGYNQRKEELSKQGQSTAIGGDVGKIDTTKVTTGSIDTTEIFNKAAESAITEQVYNIAFESQLGDKATASGLSAEDKSQYLTALAKLSERLDFFANQRNVDYPEFVSRYYGNLRKFLHSMRYGYLDEEMGYLKHIYNPSRDFEFLY